MSCGNPHETPCGEVLARVYIYLDGELEEEGCEKVRQHLDECGPCLREFGLEEAVKKLVGKACGCEPCPDELRSKVMGRIQQLCVEITELQVTELQVTDVESSGPAAGPAGVGQARPDHVLPDHVLPEQALPDQSGGPGHLGSARDL